MALGKESHRIDPGLAQRFDKLFLTELRTHVGNVAVGVEIKMNLAERKHKKLTFCARIGLLNGD
jgi:hypothetical protein